MDELKIGLLGFGPFDHHSRNPSGEIVNSLNQKKILGVEIWSRVIPVRWQDAFNLIQEIKEKQNFSALLAFGVSDDPFIRLEKYAKNYAGFHPDVSGIIHHRREIVIPGPEKYTTRLPIDWLHNEMDKMHSNFTSSKHLQLPKLEAKISFDAGDYLCNFLFYLMMHELEGKIPYRGFIHIPPLNDKQAYHDRSIERSVIQLLTIFVHWLITKQMNKFA